MNIIFSNPNWREDAIANRWHVDFDYYGIWVHPDALNDAAIAFCEDHCSYFYNDHRKPPPMDAYSIQTLFKGMVMAVQMGPSIVQAKD